MQTVWGYLSAPLGNVSLIALRLVSGVGFQTPEKTTSEFLGGV